MLAADYGTEYYMRKYQSRDLGIDNGVSVYIAENLNGTIGEYSFSTVNKKVT